MKTLLSPSIKFLMVWMCIACSDPDVETIAPVALVSSPKDDDWVRFLEDLFYERSIIVSKGGSIQDAVNQAQPGTAIYIEPGTYRERVTVDKPGIKLIGLTATNDEKVIIKSPDGDKNNIVSATADNFEIFNVAYPNDSVTFFSRRKFAQRKKGSANLKITRVEVANKIAHYTFDVRLGSGPFDIIRIHRVVKEHRAYQPVRSQGSVFMLHGASLKFEAIFLKAGMENVNPQTSSAVFLASKNIDVWGMDFAWTLVPLETTDFAFMKEWGVDRDTEHALTAMSIARMIRGLTFQGVGRMNLLGYSYGAIIAYAAAGRETQQHPVLRDIRGIIAVDQAIKYAEADESSRLEACKLAARVKQQMLDGTYHSSSGVGFGQFANLATSKPNEPAPARPTLTNYQWGLFVGTNTYALGNNLAPDWHFAGGQFNGGVPTGLLYTDPTRWFNLMKSLPPYQPQLTSYEARACACDDEDVSFDDHIRDISMPILYVGAGGGFGTIGYYTGSLTQKPGEVTNHNVTLSGTRLTDFGHADLFLGNDAANLAWAVIEQWIENHSDNNFQKL